MAQHMKTHQYGAVKILSKHSLPSDDVHKAMIRMEREIVVMKLIDHPNVLKLHDVWETGSEL
jgi:serine/threonine-protein kinase HSL1, negative regulator of Swe1 kinase